MNYEETKDLEKKNKERWLKVNPNIHDGCGIYILTRADNLFKYCYVGQSIHVLTRLAEHLEGYQHIDLSLKKHGLFGQNNSYGWNVTCFACKESELNDYEKQYIKHFADRGYQMRNKTAGGQDEGKYNIAETKPSRGYRDGLKQGYENARRDIRKLFEKNLTYLINGKTNKNKENALKKFIDFIEKEKNLKK